MHPRLLLVLAAVALLLAGAVGAPASPGAVVIPPRPLCCSNGILLHGDTLYVNHAALDRMSVIDVNARTIGTLASEADADADELITPDDLWRDPVTGDLYVTEILVNGVRRIAPDGTRTRIMAGFGDGVAHPNAITGLRRPGEPLRLFVSFVSFEPGSQTGIWEIDPSGVLPPRLVYGAAGGRAVYERGLRAPNAFAFDPQGRELFVPESYGGAVWAVDVDAHTARQVWTGSSPSANGIAVRFARDGSLLYAEQSSGRLLRLDPHGPPTQTPEVVAQLDPGIDGIAEHADGRIFLSNFRFGGISIVHPDGTVEQMFDRSLNLPNSIAPLPGGGIAVGDLGSIAVVSSSGGISRPKQFIRDDFDIAVGVAVLGSCDAYVTGFFRGTLQHVNLCDPSQAHREVVPRRTFVGGWDVATDGRDLWVSDIAGTVWRVTNVSGGNPATPLPLPGAFADPTGITYAGGRLYVAESASGVVRVVDARTGAPLDAIAGLAEPEGVAVDGSALLVVEAGTGCLTKVDLTTKARTGVACGLATDIRGVSAVPVINFFADVAIVEPGVALVSSPLDGSITRLPF